MKYILATATAWAACCAANPLCAQDLNSDEFEFQTQKARVLTELLQASASPNPKTAQSAAAAWLDLHQSIYPPLLESVDSPDLEVRARVRETLRQIVFQALCARATMTLSPEMRRQFDRLLRQEPNVATRCLMGDESERLAAVARLRKRDDLKDRIQPLLVAVIETGSGDLCATAALAAMELNVRSEDLSESLARAFARGMMNPDTDPGNQYIRQTLSPFRNYGGNVFPILQALQQIPGKSSAPILLGALFRATGNHNVFQGSRTALAEALAAGGNLGVIPALIKRLDDRTFNTSVGTPGGSISVTSSDHYLLALLGLTGQSPAAYNMVDVSSFGYNDPPYGFRKEADRTAAHAKFRAWWKAAEGLPRYKDAPPVEPVDLAKWVRPKSRTADDPAPAPTDPGSQPAEAPLPSIEPIARRLADDARRHLKGLGAPRLAVRERSQAAIAALSTNMLTAAASAEGLSESPAVDDLLRQATAEARVFLFMADLPRAERDKVLQYQKAARASLQDVFSESAVTATIAIKRLDKSDPQRLADPLLLYALRHSSMAYVTAAAETLAAGKYKSDAIGSALMEAMLRPDVRNFNRMYGTYGNFSPMTSMLKAIKAVRPPGASPVLLATLTQRTYRYDWTLDNQLVAALVEIGDKRVLPTLAQELRDPNNVGAMNSTSVNGKVIGWCPKDSLLYLGLKLTGQPPGDYSLQTHSWEANSMMIGFVDDKARKAGYKKFLDWWDKAKLTEPYKDLQPMALPQIPADVGIPVPTPFVD